MWPEIILFHDGKVEVNCLKWDLSKFVKPVVTFHEAVFIVVSNASSVRVPKLFLSGVVFAAVCR